jgi:hypothetical protein
MGNHALDVLHHELERTHDLVEHYKVKGIKEFIFSLSWKSFKKVLGLYAKEKEDVLMAYATIHYDIWKDITDDIVLPNDVEHVRLWISALTYKIESCSKLLVQLISHSQRQEDMLHHEKIFFVNLIESFNADLLKWVGSHEKEALWEITSQEDTENKNFLAAGKRQLEKQKAKLQAHIDGLPNNQSKND